MKKSKTNQEIRTIPKSKSISLRNFEVGTKILITEINTDVKTMNNNLVEST